MPVKGESAEVAPLIIHDNPLTEQLSDTTGFEVATEALQLLSPSDAVIEEGHVMVGLILSITVTVCEQVAVFPLPSVTVQITVLAPMEYVVDG